ncbi:MAG TPA: YggS family pyridoxal phosphate-dependent enzyme [Dinghuibacter sp.]|uniref:YggS family pyridoxal phosphate-dependent enzyme n=1 Tax=Dinghuibacter sp. TaxID=2024697 RepID=UPI002CC7EE4C|nr:YggS family pyridoxal phosphate-dependent enzyme [Dinghuibacter sp.]HTJ12680.1 YggS family pyridoxal phosphate-dependent enzyme [Dinghuibacter sp.]
MVQQEAYNRLRGTLPAGVTLVAVSKTKPVEDIQALYDLGHRDFGENYVQELLEKQRLLPGDIRWHFIGHLQSNKVKLLAPFVHLIHGVDGYSLLREIDKQGIKAGRRVDCLLQMHIAVEETKFGLDRDELGPLLERIEAEPLSHAHVRGLMGMATNGCDGIQLREEFTGLAELFAMGKERFPDWDTLSMGMSVDYLEAVESGSTMVRIGSLLFGTR